MTSALPIIDLSKLDNPATKEEFYKELRHVARDIGFFYVVGHGIDTKLRDDLQAAAKKFFALPQDEKDKIRMANSPHFRGYTKVAAERTRNKPDYREQIDIAGDSERLQVKETDPFWYHLVGPNQYPEDTVPELHELSQRYLAAAHAVTIKLLKAFLAALELPEDSLDALVRGPNKTSQPAHLIKLVRYPANDGSEGGDAQLQGCGPHTDPGILTLLWQDNTGGLQVKTHDGQWVDVPPVENSYVINIGETLELATNGYLLANMHQVVSRPGAKQERYSIPYFLGSSLETVEVPILTLSPELAAQARGPTADKENPLFRDIGKNAIKARLRSHLDVTERWYPEQYKEIIAHHNIS